MKKLIVLLFTLASVLAYAGPGKKAPERKTGDGPYKRLILRGGIIVNGEGAPARGPMDIVIENDRIVRNGSVENPGVLS